ncbi:hypothetical protein KIW84_053178 [Lathyrus oleraceus]|uniref:Uncharacterized protein n=1 Tax=Pisum sativum TaxID=3888 RepID=A0A9D5AD04_PEA|nr:hypothetical protein KIW84_053178 [Pisum sativum]
MWTLHDNAKDLITKCWSDTIISCLMCLLSRKLQLLKCSLKTRNRDIFENIHVMVRNSTDKVSAIQDQIALDGSSPHLRAHKLLAQQDQRDDAIPHLVDSNMNSLITRIHSTDDTRIVVFNLNKDSVPDLMALDVYFTKPIGPLLRMMFAMRFSNSSKVVGSFPSIIPTQSF